MSALRELPLLRCPVHEPKLQLGSRCWVLSACSFVPLMLLLCNVHARQARIEGQKVNVLFSQNINIPWHHCSAAGCEYEVQGCDLYSKSQQVLNFAHRSIEA